jgi:putative ABC transport system ATP-binding protein
MEAVRLDNISKEFPAGSKMITVIDDVSCTIHSEQLTMLIGPSGCGKTTLISIMSGILSPSSGSILIFGSLLSSLSDREKVEFRRQHVGFIFQQFNLLPALTATENATLPLVAAGVPHDEASQRASDLLTRIGMGAHLSKRPNQLSGGQQQRIAIARALVHKPRLVVCDEPTASLDARTGQEVMEILQEVTDEQKGAVLVVTHDNRIYNFADRIIEMEDGKITADRQASLAGKGHDRQN